MNRLDGDVQSPNAPGYRDMEARLSASSNDMQPRHAPATSSLASTRLSISTPGCPDRNELEAFVQAAFHRRHGAHVASFMPTLLGLKDGAGQVACVTGYRGAASGRLYLEHYLDRPVEEELSARLGRRVTRSAIVEVGNLAGSSCRSAIRMVTLLPQHLLGLGHEWIVFTATSAVYGILQSVGAPLTELAVADPMRVAGTVDHWGVYYRQDPRVFAGHLPAGLRLKSNGRIRAGVVAGA